MSEAIVLAGVFVFVVVALIVGHWLDEKDRHDTHRVSGNPRREVYCVINGCGGHLWADEDRLSLFATERGWAKTPGGWVCENHVTEIQAKEYLKR